jgi:hypothetical protein
MNAHLFFVNQEKQQKKKNDQLQKFLKNEKKNIACVFEAFFGSSYFVFLSDGTQN